MLVAHATFMLASVMCAYAPDIMTLIIARVAQALGGCTFLIVGQAQVGDVFERDELSEAMAFFSLSRMFAVLAGPLIGGLLCELFGWRSTFWFCAIFDAILAFISFFYVPETLTTPISERPVLTLSSPLKPLLELRHTSVGMLCVLSGVNHGAIYMPMVSIPQIMSLVTENEFIIGAMMLPLTVGTLVGSKIAGRIARPVPPKLKPGEQPPPPTEFWNRQSFCRTCFPWTVCGKYCQGLADFAPSKKTDPRFLGFRMPAVGEWRSVLIGIVLSIGGSATIGWFTVLFCDDGKLINTADTDAPNVTNVTLHVYNPLDVDDLLYRLDNNIMCDSWNWSAVALQWILGFIMCTGAMMVVVGSMTYLSINRPDARSSVAASQRCCQMLFAATTLGIGGFLFDTIGPGWMHSVVAIVSSLFISTLCFVPRDPTPKDDTSAGGDS